MAVTRLEMKGGVICSQLCVWLEKEVIALNALCNNRGLTKRDEEVPVSLKVNDFMDFVGLPRTSTENWVFASTKTVQKNDQEELMMIG